MNVDPKKKTTFAARVDIFLALLINHVNLNHYSCVVEISFISSHVGRKKRVRFYRSD